MGSSIKARAVCIMTAGARAACLTLILGRWGAPGGLNRHYWKNCRRHVKLRQLKAKTSLLHAWLLKADLLAAAVCAKHIRGTFEKTSDLNEGKNNLGYFSWCWVHSPRHLQTLSHLSGALRLNLLTWCMSNANSNPAEGFNDLLRVCPALLEELPVSMLLRLCWATQQTFLQQHVLPYHPGGVALLVQPL